MQCTGDFELAVEVATAAATLALSYFRSGVTATAKADGSPVTAADLAVERLLRESLHQARPGDAVVGEEHGAVGDSDRVWILDPIDGTSFLASGDPNWRVQIALAVAGRTELALVVAPALGRRWWATVGGGAFESEWPVEGVAPAASA